MVTPQNPNVAPFDPINPNFDQAPTGPNPAAYVVLSGIRKHVENWRQDRPEKHRDKFLDRQNFYTALAITAFDSAGVEAPAAVTDFIPDNPYEPHVPSHGRLQRRREKQVLRFADELKTVHEKRKKFDAADAYLEGSMIRRPEKLRVPKELRKERLGKAKEDYESGAISKLEYDKLKSSIPKQKFEKYSPSKSKHQRKVEKREQKLVRKIVGKTEQGFSARRRKGKLDTWEEKVDRAPIRAQKRDERLQNRAVNKEKRRYWGEQVRIQKGQEREGRAAAAAFEAAEKLRLEEEERNKIRIIV